MAARRGRDSGNHDDNDDDDNRKEEEEDGIVGYIQDVGALIATLHLLICSIRRRQPVGFVVIFFAGCK